MLLNYLRGNMRTIKNKYKYHQFTRVRHHSHLLMLITNVTDATLRLNELLRRPKLFNCINDDLSYGRKFVKENELILRMLDDFYLTLLPNSSQYELPDAETNPYQFIDDYRKWQEARRSNLCLVCFAFCNICYFILIAIFNRRQRVL